MPLTLTALEGTTGPDPFDPDPEEPDPEPPEPEPDEPEPLEPEPEPPEPEPDEPEPPEPDPDEPDPVDPDPVDPDPDEPDPEPLEPDPDEPDPAPLDPAPGFTILAEQADRQKKERLKSPKRNCERAYFIGSPTDPASAHAGRYRREVGMPLIRSTCAHTTPVGAHASFCLPLRANTTKLVAAA